ncbi:hypothetical protein B0H14DRAFT_2600056 [Mycena olivaceomarginata]|nr:hypothetical protein B0H14DRAFT_2600056 [Mycena olivaceomarginata]
MFYRASSTRGRLQKISLLEQNIIEGAHAERAGFQRRADVGQVCTKYGPVAQHHLCCQGLAKSTHNSAQACEVFTSRQNCRIFSHDEFVRGNEGESRICHGSQCRNDGVDILWFFATILNQSSFVQTAVADGYKGDISDITREVLEVWKRDLSEGKSRSSVTAALQTKNEGFQERYAGNLLSVIQDLKGSYGICPVRIRNEGRAEGAVDVDVFRGEDEENSAVYNRQDQAVEQLRDGAVSTIFDDLMISFGRDRISAIMRMTTAWATEWSLDAVILGIDAHAEAHHKARVLEV